jgi:hypothetical protein
VPSKYGDTSLLTKCVLQWCFEPLKRLLFAQRQSLEIETRLRSSLQFRG